jgi:hypothetical protein
MTGISSKYLICSSCLKDYTGATFFESNYLSNQDSCQTKLVFVCPILELKFIGLECIDVVLVDVETKQVETRTASNLFAVFLLS